MEPLSEEQAKQYRLVMINLRDKAIVELTHAQNYARILYLQHEVDSDAPRLVQALRQQQRRLQGQRVQNMRKMLYLMDKALRENLGGLNAGLCGK